ncbi:hypothetical protein [Nonomuraea sp. SBT364]|uniref:hypothetical protein n=1 Tax=Nonomuraea sp. SBT364 TaxID=1580530 RepID=UPI00066A41C1|nr:hypothetical protein [Nonomuraea sp. SBT364]
MNAQPEAPRRSRRQAPRRRGAGTVLLSTLAGLVLAAGAVAVQSLQLSAEEQGAPLTYEGVKGEMVDAGRFSVRVREVTTARTIKYQDDVVPTEQVFLVVEAEATVPKEPVHLAPAVLFTADGKKYTATDKIDKMATLAYPWIQPGWTTSGRFVFEVPASALAGAQAVFHLPLGGLYVEPMPPEAQIDLGIDEAAAKQLGSAPADVVDLGEKK